MVDGSKKSIHDNYINYIKDDLPGLTALNHRPDLANKSPEHRPRGGAIDAIIFKGDGILNNCNIQFPIYRIVIMRIP